jgi:hypothetical protein
MHRLVVSALAVPLLVQVLVGTGAASAAGSTTVSTTPRPAACKPSPTVLHAEPTPVPGMSTQQVQNATAIINAAAAYKVPERGQTLAVMTALEESSLSGTTTSAPAFYKSLTQVKNWQNLPPTLAAHAAQHNLDPDAYASFYPQAVKVVNSLTSGSGLAGLQNLASRAQAVADCEEATIGGRFALNGVRFVGPLEPTVLATHALDLAKNGGSGWHDRCQHFVAVLDGRASSGYSTALDAWQSFEAEGVAHPVTSGDGVAPPVGAWLYYRSSSNTAGHVVTYLGNGQIASTDVFNNGHVGVGPASAITDGPWHLQYLGWAPPWGSA